MDINNTTAIVTGAASGLGAATAEHLAARGANVFGLDLPGAIRSRPDEGRVGNVRYLEADVTVQAEVRAAVAEAEAEGGAPIRIVVNCAGIGPTRRVVGRDGVADLSLYEQVIRVNLLGTIYTLAVGAEVIARTSPTDDGQRGVIVNTSSIAAYDGQIGQVAYAASKGGVVAMTLAAARDLADLGIRVCTIAPGTVDTPMLATVSDAFRAALAAGVPFPKRAGLPSEYARLASMIIEHDYLNGEVIRMDGALRMAPR